MRTRYLREYSTKKKGVKKWYCKVEKQCIV